MSETSDFLPPKIPYELKKAQQDGKLVVFVGAGVSMPPPSSLPDFNDLAKKLKDKLGPSFKKRARSESIDQFIGRMVDENHDVRKWVRDIFLSEKSKPNKQHANLIKLFTQPKDVKIVTTNFDSHLSTAARAKFEDSNDINEYLAPALPLGREFSGIVYLHGRADRGANELVLTDRDFGKAYLADGWARRFMLALFRHYHVLFVGYSHEDSVLRYLARGLFDKTQRFAFATEAKEDHWKRLGIKIIKYEQIKRKRKFKLVWEAISSWSNQTQWGLLDHERRITNIVSIVETTDPILSPHSNLTKEDARYLIDAIQQEHLLRLFCDKAKHTYWLEWLEQKEKNKEAEYDTNEQAWKERLEFSKLFSPTAEIGERERVLAWWFAKSFVGCDDQQGLIYLTQRGQTVNPALWDEIARVLAHGKKLPKPETYAKWLSVLMNTVPQHKHALDRILTSRNLNQNYWRGVLNLFQFLTTPRLELEDDYMGELIKGEKKVNANISMLGDKYCLDEAWKRILKPLLPTLSSELAVTFTGHFWRAHSLLVAAGKAGPMWNPVSFSRSAIEPHEQDSQMFGFELIIDYARDVIEFIIENDTRQADALIQIWISSKVPILARLAVHAMRKSIHVSFDDKLRWVLEWELIYKHLTKHEVFMLLEHAFPKAGQDMQLEVIERAKIGPHRDEGEDTEHAKLYEYEIYCLLYWLKKHAPKLHSAQQAFDEVQSRNKEFSPPDHPEFYKWSSGAILIEGFSPIDADELLLKPAAEQVEYLMNGGSESRHIFEREGLMGQVGIAARKNPSWGLDLAEVLRDRTEWKEDIWSSILNAWHKPPFNKEDWPRALGILGDVNILSNNRYTIGYILWHASEMKNIWTEATLHEAEAITERFWDIIGNDAPERTPADDWLFEAINHPAGQLTLFWLHLIERRAELAGHDPDTIPDKYKERFEAIISGTSYASQLGRVTLASQIRYAFSLDRQWTVDNLLPLLDWNKDEHRAEQCWHGFIGWGTPPFELLKHLKPLYEQATEKFPPEASRLREHLMQHLAFMALSLENPLQDKWLLRVRSHMIQEGDLLKWTHRFRFVLIDIPDNQKKAIWDRWLCQYWKDRTEGIFGRFVEEEAAGMLSWALELGPVIGEVVNVICNSDPVDVGSTSIYIELVESRLAEKYPDPTADLLHHLAKGHKHPLPAQESYMCHEMSELVKELHKHGASIDKLKAICEELAKLGCTEAPDPHDSLK